MYTHTRARALINGRATNLNTKKKKKKNLLHSRAPYFIRANFRSIVLLQHTRRFCFSPLLFWMQDKRKKVSLVSRGAASSPFIFRHFFFYSPVRYHEGLRVLVFFLIVPSQKKERFPQLRVWCLLVRVFASVARERERERDVRRPFFFRSSRFWDDDRFPSLLERCARG